MVRHKKNRVNSSGGIDHSGLAGPELNELVGIQTNINRSAARTKGTEI
jgi:hypothetical protein